MIKTIKEHYMDIDNHTDSNFKIEQINFISNNSEKVPQSLDNDIDEKVLNLFLQNHSLSAPTTRQHKENSIVNNIIENSKQTQVVPITLRKRMLYKTYLN